jgi:CheY-like chemotaxis protein
VVAAPILIVEDNRDDVVFLVRALQIVAPDAPLRIVNTGAGAIDYLMGQGEYSDRAQHPLPAFVLLDLNMPVASGFVVLRWLREQPILRRLPVVVLTSSSQEHDVSLAYDLGVSSYVLKPSGLKRMNEVAAQLASYWSTLNHRPPLYP